MVGGAWLARLRSAAPVLLPATLFGRLALLLFVTVLASHALVLTLLFELRPAPPPPPPPHPAGLEAGGPALEFRPGMPPPRPPELGGPRPLHAGMLLDLGVRLVALMLAAWIGARWLSRPIRQLARAARELGQDVYRPPLPEHGAEEFREASRVFNQMQAQIRRQLEERDRFVAAVSHDLRTPLTRLRLRAETLADLRERQGFQRDIDGMEEMIRATLDYLRGAADEEPFVLLDPRALVQSLADDHPAGPQAVQIEGKGEARPLRAQASALRRAIGNLVDNAVRYGEVAQIRLRDEPQCLRIEISDRGPGIPEDQLEPVFEPFYRLESSRNRHTGGIGLGLSITRDIARRHRGSLTLRNKPEGNGLLAVLELPRE